MNNHRLSSGNTDNAMSIPQLTLPSFFAHFGFHRVAFRSAFLIGRFLRSLLWCVFSAFCHFRQFSATLRAQCPPAMRRADLRFCSGTVGERTHSLRLSSALRIGMLASASCLCYPRTGIQTHNASSQFGACGVTYDAGSHFCNYFRASLLTAQRCRRLFNRIWASLLAAIQVRNFLHTGWIDFPSSPRLRNTITGSRAALSSSMECRHSLNNRRIARDAVTRIGVRCNIEPIIVRLQCVQVILFANIKFLNVAQFKDANGKRISAMLSPRKLQMSIGVYVISCRANVFTPTAMNVARTTNIDLACGDTGDLVNTRSLRKWYTRHISDPFSIVGHALGCLQQREGLRVSEKSIPRSAVYRNRTR